MNISPFTIYLWQLADELKTASFVIAVILGISLIVSISWSDDMVSEETYRSTLRWIKKAVGIVAVFIFISVFTPSTKPSP